MSEPVQAVASSSRRGHRIALALIVLIVVIGFLLPLININRYHRTIADSLTRSLGHTVRLGSVNLELFPLPGLAIHDLVVEEDPSFGAEPLLRAPSVTVFLRLSSLWRQRLEISRIDLDNASVNLARDPSERWNFASLLLQASRSATAPTAQRHPSAAPRFPYIDFHSARINFKVGNEKKALSFLNSDASVWLADPNQWRIRFEAQPARTDRNLELEDTGIIRLDGSLTRANALDQLPLKLHAEWTGAQLGQVSRLMLGNDSGWRGDLRVEADIAGDMQNLVMQSRLRVIDAHRQEFTPLTPLDIDTRCEATYHHPQQSLDNLTCLLPAGDGHLLLTGAIANIAHPQPNLNLEINHTPLTFALSILSLVRRTLPATLDAAGTINGQFTWAPRTPSQTAVLTGHAVVDTVVLRLSGMSEPVTFAALRFATPAQAAPSFSSKPHHRNRSAPPSLATAHVVLLEPAAFAAGAPTPMQVSGQLSRHGFSLHFTGESTLARLQPVARNISQLGALENLAPQGTAQTDLTMAGPWLSDSVTPDPGVSPVNAQPGSAAQGATAQGWIRLQHAQLKPSWLPEPIEIATATAQFGDPPGNSVTWANANVSVNGIAARGSASYPANCGDPSGCPAQVNLDFPALDAAALQSALLGAGRHGEFLQAILSRVESPAPPLPPINGTIHAGTLTIRNLKLTNARAAITVSRGRVNILSLDADTLGGSAHITGSIAAASDGPEYALNLTCSEVRLTEAASLFHEKWGTGSVDGQMNLNLHGYSSLAATATGDFRWVVNGNWAGNWPASLPENPAAHLAEAALLNTPQTKSRSASWTASGTIANQALTLEKGPAKGTISFDRQLDLAWTGTATEPATQSAAATSARDQTSIHITGTLAHPLATEKPANPQAN